MLQKKIPIKRLTDSKILFDVITKFSNTSERRLMNDLSAVKNDYSSHEISNIGFY